MDDRLRASDADRDRVAALLRVHFAAGRLTPGELDDRLAATLAAMTWGDLRRALAGLPGPPPVPGQDSRLEHGYRRLLVFYPARYRRVHEEEMLAVLMTAAPQGKTRPSLAEAADLILGALRVRCQPVRGGVAGPGWRGVLALMGAGAVIGLLAGAGYALDNPPMPASAALVVVLSPATRDVPTQVAMAVSRPVLSMALHSSALQQAEPRMSLQTLRSRVQVKALTSTSVISITAQGRTAIEATGTANAVALSYVAYVSGENTPGGNGRVQAFVLDNAAILPGTPLFTDVLATSGFGALGGALLGAIGAVALSPRSRRFRIT